MNRPIEEIKSELIEYKNKMDDWWIKNQQSISDINVLLEHRSMAKKEKSLCDELVKALDESKKVDNTEAISTKPSMIGKGTFKLAESLDNIANILESKGLVKEAYELDKVADYVEANLLNSFGATIKPLHEKIDLSNGVTVKLGDEIVTVVKKPNAIFFALEDDSGKQTSAGYIDLLKDADLADTVNKMSTNSLAKFYLDNIDSAF